jgi:hypothetical protein
MIWFDPATDNLKAIEASQHEHEKVWLSDELWIWATIPKEPKSIRQEQGDQYLLRVLDNHGEIAVATENGRVSSEFARGVSAGVLLVTIGDVGQGWVFERTHTWFRDWAHFCRDPLESEVRRPPGKGWQFINVVHHKTVVWYRIRTWEVYQ